jgi:hypothetical protein
VLEAIRNKERFHDWMLQHHLDMGNTAGCCHSYQPCSTLLSHDLNSDGKNFTAGIPGMPPCVVLSDPKCIEYVLKTKFDNYEKVRLDRLL